MNYQTDYPHLKVIFKRIRSLDVSFYKEKLDYRVSNNYSSHIIVSRASLRNDAVYLSSSTILLVVSCSNIVVKSWTLAVVGLLCKKCPCAERIVVNDRLKEFQ